MKTILVLHTGGTIAMSSDKNGTIVPGKQNPLNSFTNPFTGKIKLDIRNPFNLPSPHIGPDQMLVLRNEILTAENNGVDGVVITHGTDTLEETAYFLDLTLPAETPVVVTGAMRSADEIGSDGLHNFQTAILTAASDQAHGKGVLVVMNDEIHTARFVTKTHTTNVATFRTPTFGPVGSISKDRVTFYSQLIRQTYIPIDHIVKNVFLLKAYAGMDSELFAALANQETKGVVIEALGAGNLPPAALPGLKSLLDLKIPVVIVSRCFNGTAESVYDYEGGGVRLEQMGAIFCHGLNGQKARIKLAVGLSKEMAPAELTQFVSDAVS
ncbi:L-asparaginase [Ligilactobacillus salitolerans]|uniref:asparaginase n=1 Tax=Ligilactobacillus salitolerans TaxID=1808352 RepID=A0A401IVE3_9LACO|nr:asparaginase [Ligilactobacillus salitolerans]GBG95521.1 L-asparaginase [Ligilactobacillus salitolerans]